MSTREMLRVGNLAAVSALVTSSSVWAQVMTPTPTPSPLPPAPSAEGEYARGVAATRAKEWSVAAVAFSRAVEMKPAYPEAWNGLGFALRNQGKYAESLEAYDEALRLQERLAEAVREMKRYFEYVRDESLKRYNAGMSFEQAARDIALDGFQGWMDEERIVVNVYACYREFTSGNDARSVGALFGDMARYYYERKAKRGHAV